MVSPDIKSGFANYPEHVMHDPNEIGKKIPSVSNVAENVSVNPNPQEQKLPKVSKQDYGLSWD